MDQRINHEGNQKIFYVNSNKNTTYQKFQGETKAVFRKTLT